MKTILNEDELAQLFIDAADVIVVRTALNDLLLLWENENGDVAYQGVPQAEDEEGTKIDPNGGWLSSLTTMVWPLTYLGAGDPGADGRVSGETFSAYERGGPFVIEFDYRSDDGPDRVGPFGSREAAEAHAATLLGHGWSAEYTIMPIAGAHVSRQAREQQR